MLLLQSLHVACAAADFVCACMSPSGACRQADADELRCDIYWHKSLQILVMNHSNSLADAFRPILATSSNLIGNICCTQSVFLMILHLHYVPGMILDALCSHNAVQCGQLTQ